MDGRRRYWTRTNRSERDATELRLYRRDGLNFQGSLGAAFSFGENDDGVDGRLVIPEVGVDGIVQEFGDVRNFVTAEGGLDPGWEMESFQFCSGH